MKPAFYLTAILLFAALFILSSCDSDETVNIHSLPPEILGKVVGESGLALYPARVILDSNSSADVNPDGSFNFKNAAFPYNLIIYRPQENVYVCYQNLKTPRPQLYMIGYYSPVNSKHAVLYVGIPKTTVQGKYTKVTFISKQNAFVTDEAGPNDSTVALHVYWEGTQSIEGRVLLMKCTVIYGQSRIITYDKFGYKDTTLQDAGNVQVRFADNYLYYYPPESDVFVHFTSFSNNAYYRLGFSFNGYGMNSNMMFFYLAPAAYNFLDLRVPGSLPMPFKVRIETRTDFSDNSQLYEFAYIPILGSFTTEPKPGFIQMFPSADTVGVDYATEFSHNGTSGVFVTEFRQVNGSALRILIVSDSNKVHFPDLRSVGVLIMPGSRFDWRADWYPCLQNIDEFVSDKRISAMPYSYYTTGFKYFRFK